MFNSMVDKCVMTQLQQFSIFLEKTSRSCGNILYFYQHCQSDKLTLEVMLLMIEYLIYGQIMDDCCSRTRYWEKWYEYVVNALTT